MPNKTFTALGGLNLKVSPINQENGALLRCTNMYTDEIGAKTKRWGYEKFLDNPDSSYPTAVESLFAPKNLDNDYYIFRNSNGVTYYWKSGLSPGTAWTKCTNGTTSQAASFVEFDNQVISSGGTMRYTTDGTAWTDIPGAPGTTLEVASSFSRVFARQMGSYDLFYSSINEGTNWSSVYPSDSSSFYLPEGGGLKSIYKVANKLCVAKTSGKLTSWDDYELTDIPTDRAPTEGEFADGYYIGRNDYGIYGFGGDRPENISFPVEYIYEKMNGNSHITTTGFFNKWVYFPTSSAVNMVDGRADNEIDNGMLVYDIQLNQWFCWSMGVPFYKFCVVNSDFYSVVGGTGYFSKPTLLAGDEAGQVYVFKEDVYSDDGDPINCLLEGVIHLNEPFRHKIWQKIEALANPGCQATLMLAAANTLDTTGLNWVTVGSLEKGVISHRQALNGRFLFYRIVESSTTAPFTFYGFNLEYEFIGD